MMSPMPYKKSFFNDLQSKLTGSNPVVLTTFPHLDSGSKYNDLANNSLKTLPNLNHYYLEFITNLGDIFIFMLSKC